MAKLSGTSHAEELNSLFLQLSARLRAQIVAETAQRYKQHVRVCDSLGLAPANALRFCTEIAEQIHRDIYDPHHKLTPANDAGCQRLLDEVFVRAQRLEQLEEWHAQYMLACEIFKMPAYSLALILDAVGHERTPLNLERESLQRQAERINEIVANYVRRAGRKENPRWFARRRKNKPSKVFNKYAD